MNPEKFIISSSEVITFDVDKVTDPIELEQVNYSSWAIQVSEKIGFDGTPEITLEVSNDNIDWEEYEAPFFSNVPILGSKRVYMKDNFRIIAKFCRIRIDVKNNTTGTAKILFANFDS